MAMSVRVGYGAEDPFADDPVKELARVLLGRVREMKEGQTALFWGLDDGRPAPASDAERATITAQLAAQACIEQRDVRALARTMDYYLRCVTQLTNDNPMTRAELVPLCADLAKKCICVHRDHVAIDETTFRTVQAVVARFK